MSENTAISWTDHTFNPWTGCTKVSPGCANCYAEGWAKRSGIVKWGRGMPRRRTSEANWKLPLKWNREAGQLAALQAGSVHGIHRRPRVFCASLADWLDDEVSINWLSDLLYLVAKCSNLDWLMLTKRPHLWRSRLEAVAELEDVGSKIAQVWLNGTHLRNVWIGTTVEDFRAALAPVKGGQL